MAGGELYAVTKLRLHTPIRIPLRIENNVVSGLQKESQTSDVGFSFDDDWREKIILNGKYFNLELYSEDKQSPYNG